ncbi:MAG: DNA methyltransferase [Patescibacteria group bacterium]
MTNLNIVYVPISQLKSAEYNPRKFTDEDKKQLADSITAFGIVDPLLVNIAENRKNIVVGGNMRLSVLKKLGFKDVPIVQLNIPDIEKEKELCLRLNKNTGRWNFDLLAEFDESFLADIGFESETLDDIFGIDDNPEVFDLKKELEKLSIKKIEIQKGDVWKMGSHRMMCGDSTVEAEILKLMNGEKADMCFTDSPYILNYLKGKKKNGKTTEGFGYKRDRRYLETDVLPPDFTEKWMANIHKIQKEDFTIIAFENWKNIPLFWQEMEKYWKIKNLIVWHIPNRVQGFAAKHRFFNKHDIAMVGASGNVNLNLKLEEELFQNEYETALYATSGKPHWEGYEKGKKICPTDFIEFKAADEKSSGQGIIFGTKPTELLCPYIKVLTKRGDLIIEPFGGSGSTLIAAQKMDRRCYLMEKSPVYAEVIRHRWEKFTGLKAIKL